MLLKESLFCLFPVVCAANGEPSLSHQFELSRSVAENGSVQRHGLPSGNDPGRFAGDRAPDRPDTDLILRRRIESEEQSC